MGIFGALTTSVAGMRAQSFALENISGNIANSQTTAFKRIDSSFLDLIPDNPPSKQLSGTVAASARATNTVQGDFQSASIGTFMAINGDGFFVVQKPSSFTDGRPTFDGSDLYTRRGDFQTDKDGFLVNGAGYYLMGIPVDAKTGNLSGSVPQLLKFQNDFLPAQPTTQIQYRANLAAYPATTAHDTSVPGSELIDPRTVAPLDVVTVVESVGRTGRLVCVQEAPPAGSWGQAVISHVAVEAFELLDAPPVLIAADPIPVPYARSLEEATLPGVERIAGAVRAVIAA